LSSPFPYTTLFRSRAYELEIDIAWEDLANVGISVGRSEDGTRHTNIGVAGGSFYVDRGPSDRDDYSFAEFTQAEAPIDPEITKLHLRIFVDMQSVEVFVDGGPVLSQQVYFIDGDDGISLYTDGGAADFTGITIREF